MSSSVAAADELIRPLLLDLEHPLDHEFMWHSYSRLCNGMARSVRVRDAHMGDDSVRRGVERGESN